MVMKSPQVIVQSGLWKTYMNTAAEAYNQGRYTDAEEPLKAALKEVQRLGQDSPLGTTLNKLALLYHAQGMYAEAEPLYKRSLAIREALGSEHSNLARALITTRPCSGRQTERTRQQNYEPVPGRFGPSTHGRTHRSEMKYAKQSLQQSKAGLIRN